MKKNLPLILVGGGIILLLLAVFVVVRSLKNSVSTGNGNEEEEVIPELPESQWPAVSLTPTTDAAIPNSLGHLLKLKVEKINVPGASSMDYLMVYNTSNGGQQGVPGTVQLTGAGVERNLLLGSESSGKYRFDDGVTQGTITVTFRNSGGKSLGKLTGDFHMQTNETGLTSLDGKFTYTLDKAVKGVYFITMPTFKEPETSVVWKDGYGVFASDGKSHEGKIAQ
jgi:hypothetical protein